MTVSYTHLDVYKRQPFVCLEPWMGRCDNTGYDKELSQKPNINVLEPEGIFDKSYVISVR